MIRLEASARSYSAEDLTLPPGPERVFVQFPVPTHFCCVKPKISQNGLIKPQLLQRDESGVGPLMNFESHVIPSHKVYSQFTTSSECFLLGNPLRGTLYVPLKACDLHNVFEDGRFRRVPCLSLPLQIREYYGIPDVGSLWAFFPRENTLVYKEKLYGWVGIVLNYLTVKFMTKFENGAVWKFPRICRTFGACEEKTIDFNLLNPETDRIEFETLLAPALVEYVEKWKYPYVQGSNYWPEKPFLELQKSNYPVKFKKFFDNFSVASSDDGPHNIGPPVHLVYLRSRLYYAYEICASDFDSIRPKSVVLLRDAATNSFRLDSLFELAGFLDPEYATCPSKHLKQMIDDPNAIRILEKSDDPINMYGSWLPCDRALVYATILGFGERLSLFMSPFLSKVFPPFNWFYATFDNFARASNPVTPTDIVPLELTNGKDILKDVEGKVETVAMCPLLTTRMAREAVPRYPNFYGVLSFLDLVSFYSVILSAPGVQFICQEHVEPVNEQGSSLYASQDTCGDLVSTAKSCIINHKFLSYIKCAVSEDNQVSAHEAKLHGQKLPPNPPADSSLSFNRNTRYPIVLNSKIRNEEFVMEFQSTLSSEEIIYNRVVTLRKVVLENLIGMVESRQVAAVGIPLIKVFPEHCVRQVIRAEPALGQVFIFQIYLQGGQDTDADLLNSWFTFPIKPQDQDERAWQKFLARLPIPLHSQTTYFNQMPVVPQMPHRSKTSTNYKRNEHYEQLREFWDQGQESLVNGTLPKNELFPRYKRINELFSMVFCQNESGVLLYDPLSWTLKYVRPVFVQGRNFIRKHEACENVRQSLRLSDLVNVFNFVDSKEGIESTFRSPLDHPDYLLPRRMLQSFVLERDPNHIDSLSNSPSLQSLDILHLATDEEADPVSDSSEQENSFCEMDPASSLYSLDLSTSEAELIDLPQSVAQRKNEDPNSAAALLQPVSNNCEYAYGQKAFPVRSQGRSTLCTPRKPQIVSRPARVSKNLHNTLKVCNIGSAANNEAPVLLNLQENTKKSEYATITAKKRGLQPAASLSIASRCSGAAPVVENRSQEPQNQNRSYSSAHLVAGKSERLSPRSIDAERQNQSSRNFMTRLPKSAAKTMPTLQEEGENNQVKDNKVLGQTAVNDKAALFKGAKRELNLSDEDDFEDDFEDDYDISDFYDSEISASDESDLASLSTTLSITAEDDDEIETFMAPGHVARSYKEIKRPENSPRQQPRSNHQGAANAISNYRDTMRQSPERLDNVRNMAVIAAINAVRKSFTYGLPRSSQASRMSTVEDCSTDKSGDEHEGTSSRQGTQYRPQSGVNQAQIGASIATLDNRQNYGRPPAAPRRKNQGGAAAAAAAARSSEAASSTTMAENLRRILHDTRTELHRQQHQRAAEKSGAAASKSAAGRQAAATAVRKRSARALLIEETNEDIDIVSISADELQDEIAVVVVVTAADDDHSSTAAAAAAAASTSAAAAAVAAVPPAVMPPAVSLASHQRALRPTKTHPLSRNTAAASSEAVAFERATPYYSSAAAALSAVQGGGLSTTSSPGSGSSANLVLTATRGAAGHQTPVSPSHHISAATALAEQLSLPSLAPSSHQCFRPRVAESQRRGSTRSGNTAAAQPESPPARALLPPLPPQEGAESDEDEDGVLDIEH